MARAGRKTADLDGEKLLSVDSKIARYQRLRSATREVVPDCGCFWHSVDARDPRQAQTSLARIAAF
ncbi:MAG: hypothetical protein RL385_408 [Pseudomonadota bacterium]|jgi:hypothetical protein